MIDFVLFFWSKFRLYVPNLFLIFRISLVILLFKTRDSLRFYIFYLCLENCSRNVELKMFQLLRIPRFNDYVWKWYTAGVYKFYATQILNFVNMLRLKYIWSLPLKIMVMFWIILPTTFIILKFFCFSFYSLIDQDKKNIELNFFLM